MNRVPLVVSAVNSGFLFTELGQVTYPPSARRTDKINLFFPISAPSLLCRRVGGARVHTQEGSPKSLTSLITLTEREFGQQPIWNEKSGVHEANKVLLSITARAIRPPSLRIVA